MKVIDIMMERMSFSFEIFPPKHDKPIEPLIETLNHLYKFKPDFISCTYGAGGTNEGRNKEVCKIMKEHGMTIPVTHFTCIGNTKEKINQSLKEYLEIGIDHILAMRGDFPQGWEETRGDFDYANQLVEYIRINFPEFTIAVAGNPEKHHEARSLDEDISHLRVKQDAGGDFIMTQLCYDVDNFLYWMDRIRSAQVILPVDVGIMPVLSKDAVIKMTVSNGSSIPRDLAELIARYGDNPDDFKKAGKEYTAELIYKFINAGTDGIHIYALNKWQDVTDILNDASIRY